MKARHLLACLFLLAIVLALHAQDTDSLDVSIVIDASQSMEGGLLSSAVNAAGQFIQLLEIGDEVAVSAYSNYAHTYFHMTQITNTGQLSAAVGSMNNIEVDEFTSIGAGMIRALEEMNDIVSVNPTVGMILLSDGLENYQPMVQQVIGAVPGIVDIHTIGYGPDCDEALMQAIANATGGSYHHASSGGVTATMQEIWNDLICGDIAARYNGVVIAGRTATVMIPVNVHRGMREIVFNLAWGQADNDFSVTLISPDGQVYEPQGYSTSGVEYKNFPTQTFYRFNDPQPGEWSVIIDPSSNMDDTFLLTVGGPSELKFDFSFDRPSYQVGDFVHVYADLRYSGLPVYGAQIEATVERMDGSTFNLSLSESSLSNGGGQYLGGFRADSEDAYTVRLHAFGQTEDGAYDRYRGKSVYVGDQPRFDEVPGLLTLSADNYPNPFNPTTTIRFNIPEESPVRLDVYNVRGQKVRTLVRETMSAGPQQVVWNGDDENGEPVSSGCYLYRLQSGGQSVSGRMLLLK